MVKWLMYSCKRGVTQRPRSVSSSGYCENIKASIGRSSRINCGATASLIESSFQRRFTAQPSTPLTELSYRTSRRQPGSWILGSLNLWRKHSGGGVHNLFNLGRRLAWAENYRYFRLGAFAFWERLRRYRGSLWCISPVL